MAKVRKTAIIKAKAFLPANIHSPIGDSTVGFYGCQTGGMPSIHLITIVVDDYDSAIDFFTRILDFDLVEDSPSLTNDGRPKRWVEVRPKGGETGILLAKADGEQQAAAVGHQVAGRVGFFLRVDDFETAHQRMVSAGVTFTREPWVESYGRVAVFVDIAGNKWDLLGPA